MEQWQVAQRYNARKSLRLAIYHGLLVPGDCARCGAANNIHGHHPDYSQPLVVIWLCRRCHSRHHAHHADVKERPRRKRIYKKAEPFANPIEQEIVRDPSRTMTEIAKVCGVSRVRIHQILKRMIAGGQLARSNT